MSKTVDGRCGKCKEMKTKLIDLNGNEYIKQENGWYKCQSCNCYTMRPGEHECPELMKKIKSYLEEKNETKQT